MPRQLQTIVLSQSEARAIDEAIIRQLGIPGLLLMENAAHGVTQQLTRYAAGNQVVIVCGPGNNGGDGLAIALQRAADGLMSHVIMETAGKPLSADAQSNFEFLTRSGVPVQVVKENGVADGLLDSLTPDDWIVDSLLGTGINGDLQAPFDRWVSAINSSRAHVLAVDVPSGLNCDDGTCGNACVRADTTVTFVGMKQGFLAPTAQQQTGQIVIAHIGVPHDWVAKWLNDYRSR